MFDTQSPPEPSTNGNGRESNGRFAKGNDGGTGNPFARQVAALRKVLLDGVSPEDMTAIIARMVARAKAGDVAAAKLVLCYTVGKPAASVDPDRLDVDEWQRFKDSAGMMIELPKLVTMPVAELPLTMLRAARPAVSSQLGSSMAEMLRHPEKYRGDRQAMKELFEGKHKAPSPNGKNGAAGNAQPSPNGFDGEKGGVPEPANGNVAVVCP